MLDLKNKGTYFKLNLLFTFTIITIELLYSHMQEQRSVKTFVTASCSGGERGIFNVKMY